MPAVTPPQLPVTYRARNLLIWASALSVVLVVACYVGWNALDPSLQAQFTWFQVATLIFFAAFMIAMMMGLGLSRVIAEPDGIRIRNGIMKHHYTWQQIREFRYKHGDPWAYVVLNDNPDDPSRRQMIGIQTTDGIRAHRAVAELRVLLEESRQRSR